MEAIEERAKRYVSVHVCADKQTYIDGATEQKAIEAEKACINFCVACPTYKDCDDRYNCPVYDKFEKSMKE